MMMTIHKERMICLSCVQVEGSLRMLGEFGKEFKLTRALDVSTVSLVFWWVKLKKMKDYFSCRRCLCLGH